jgi:hypothetical protein
MTRLFPSSDVSRGERCEKFNGGEYLTTLTYLTILTSSGLRMFSL